MIGGHAQPLGERRRRRAGESQRRAEGASSALQVRCDLLASCGHQVYRVGVDVDAVSVYRVRENTTEAVVMQLCQSDTGRDGGFATIVPKVTMQPGQIVSI